MKRIFALLLGVILILTLYGCSQSDLSDNSEQEIFTQTSETQASSASVASDESQLEHAEQPTTRRMVMTIGENRAVVILNDSLAADSLYAQLPLTVSFEDYNSVEKIAYLTDALNTSDAPEAFDPDVGDFCLYAPWGNLSVFYKDFRNSNSLISLGRVETGLEYIEGMHDGTTVVLEKSE